jgi:hypothetical protein
LGIAAIRQAARKRVEKATLQQVADEIGISVSGLWSFLRRGQPQRKTMRKLVAWHSASSLGRARGVSRGDVNAAMLVIAQYIGEGLTESAARRRLAEVLETISMEAGLSAMPAIQQEVSNVVGSLKRR